MKYIVSMAFLLTILLGCKSNDKASNAFTVIDSKKMPSGKVVFGPMTESRLVDDNQSPLGIIMLYHRISSDTALALSRSGLSLFVNDTLAKVLIKRGGGPNEYKRIYSLFVQGDTICILNEPDEMIYYSMQRGSIISRKHFPEIVGAHSALRLPNNALLFSNIYISEPNKAVEDSVKLMYTMNDAGSGTHQKTMLALTQGVLNFSRIITPVMEPGRNFLRLRDSVVCIRHPFSPYLTLFNWKTNTFSLVKMQTVLQYAEKQSEENDKKIKQESDFTLDAFPLEHAVAVPLLRKGKAAIDRKTCIQFYTYAGQSIGEIEYEHSQYGIMPIVVDISDSVVTMLALDKDTQSSHPYKIIRQKYEITK
jgi:hypothetical protein